MKLSSAVTLCLAAFLTLCGGKAAARSFEVASPDGKIHITVDVADKITWSASADGKQVIAPSGLSMELEGETLGLNPKLSNYKTGSADETLHPVVAFKFSEIKNRYNWLRLNFKGSWAVEFRVYDDGAAYRFVTSRKGELIVVNEAIDVNFPTGCTAHLQQPGGFKTAYEEPYTHVALSGWKAADRMSVLPALFAEPSGCKILFSESGTLDYPHVFIKGTGADGFTAAFPKVPTEFGEDGDRSLKILAEGDYIAKTKGTRDFPWRWFVIAQRDGQLIETTMTARLAPPSAVADPSWIRPGQVSWEWWSGATPYGPDVNFVSGFNMDTYKYFIDFAAANGIPYILMDEGWAKTTRDPYTPNPKVDVHEIIRYGEEKGVGVFLWLTWLVTEQNMDLFETFSRWGVKGVKVDFMDRSDQWMVNYYERAAAEAAKHKMMIAFHGSFKPAGLEYKYPNLLAYEGVRGMEQMGGCTPSNSVWFPYMRNAVGPMDYTPGAMISTQPESYCSQRPNSASIGTRAYQMALFVLFETGFQMLADNPTLYYRERECTEFITKVPVTWDETRAVAASAGQYAVVAKRKGDKWFIGAMNGQNEPEWFDTDITLDFLDTGREYDITWFEDGVNAPRQAMDYRKKTGKVKKGDRITMHMSRNGGWTAIIE